MSTREGDKHQSCPVCRGRLLPQPSLRTTFAPPDAMTRKKRSSAHNDWEFRFPNDILHLLRTSDRLTHEALLSKARKKAGTPEQYGILMRDAFLLSIPDVVVATSLLENGGTWRLAPTSIVEASLKDTSFLLFPGILKSMMDRGGEVDAWGHRLGLGLELGVRLRLGLGHPTSSAFSVTALHVAALEGDIRLIQALKEVGANLSLRDGLWNSAVHLLSMASGTSLLRLEEMEREGTYAITWMALQPNVDVNAKNSIGLTALHVASSPLAVHQLKSGGAEWMYVTMVEKVPHLAMERTFLRREESVVSPLGTAYLFHPMDSFVSIGQQMILSYGLSESDLVLEDRQILEWLRSQDNAA